MSAPAAGQKIINLGLQGGGAHGAFTWGVLDKLLEDGRLCFEGISGTSAGALNAVALADGMARDGAAGARDRLREFWMRVSAAGRAGASARDFIGAWMGSWRMPAMQPFRMIEAMTNFSSPYGFNPMNINPLREIVVEMVDFEKVRACAAPRLFISATAVKTGKIKVFSDGAITADAVLASACLPYLFQTVEVDGEPYWDGGFTGNPALFPFFTETKTSDILLVQINPIERNAVPTSAKEILERMSEITFNASLLREIRAIDFVNRMLDQGRLDPGHYRHNRVHRVDAGKALENFSASTKFDTSRAFFEELHAAGREVAGDWLQAHFADIGVRDTVDLGAQFQ
ncbi:MAG: patatin-like phospholipase family protein [Candidatus Kaistia colombiensis]|nr:MAG: patatin-like phospholipase family protein [Kaistia sp.]